MISDISKTDGRFYLVAEITSGLHTIDLYAAPNTGTSYYTDDRNYNLYNFGIDFTQLWWDDYGGAVGKMIAGGKNSITR